jgi:GT2 family glycosyltransferase
VFDVPEEAGEAGDDTDVDLPAESAAPAVVAVVVTHDPGPWFDETLTALRDQDYPALSVLVVDTDGEHDPTPAIARVLPSAYVRRLDTNPGFGVAANEVLHVVEGAAFFLFCHDDVAPAPDAVRAMVEEAFRSNAGVVTPKVVEWHDPTRLLSVGRSADKTGVPAQLVEPGELDQEQHDSVADVFCAPGGCTLVRSDLFGVLHGFDPGIDFLGEDLDLSWRAQVAGARVIAAPAAVVRHFEASDTDRPIDNRREVAARHRIRTMLTCYGPWHRARVVPQAVVLTFIEVVYAVLAGRRDHARDLIAAWRWNLARRNEIKANRAALAAIRQLPDKEVRRLQMRGSARLAAFLRGQLTGGGDDRLQSVTSAGRDLAGSIRTGPLRNVVAVWGAVVFVLVFGSRQLLAGKIPAFADLPAFPSRPWTLFTEWFSGWRNAGLGSESPAPTAFAILGVLGLPVLGAMSLLRWLLFVLMLPIGVAGAWRLTLELRSTTARLVGLVTFLAIPLPYDAIARGQWGGLMVWAAAPWILRLLMRGIGTEPFEVARPSRRRTILAFGLVLALVAAFVPIMVFVVPIVALGLAFGGVLAGARRGGTRIVGTSIGASAVAIGLHLPWTLDFVLPGSQWSAIGGIRSNSARLSVGDLMRFHTGPIGGSLVGYAFLVVAALPLVFGRSWRIEWATRAWTLALTCWAIAWAGQQSWFHFALGPPEALLAPAAAALALSAALGVAAFDTDLPGYRFGWRQIAPVVAGLALAIGIVPVLAAMFDGRWQSPDQSYSPVLAFLHDEQASAGPFRVVWVGDPDVLPLQGWRLSDGVAYATTDHGLPTVEDRWPGTSDGATSLVADALRLAQQRDTSRLGRLVAPMGIRYFVIAGQSAPGSGDTRPLPADVERALGEQLDLQEVLADPNLHVYRNVSWAPIRTELKGDAVSASQQSPFFDAAASTDLTNSPPVLTDQAGYASAKGKVNAGSTIYLGDASSPRWSLTVNGNSAPRTKAFGWANSFAVDQGGTAALHFDTPVSRYALLAIQVFLWAVAVRRLLRWRAEERSAASVAEGAPT